MAWMPKSEAAAALGLSPLVLSRQIAIGRFRTKTVGRKVLVEVGEAEKSRFADRRDAQCPDSESAAHLPYESPRITNSEVLTNDSADSDSARRNKDSSLVADNSEDSSVTVENRPTNELVDDSPKAVVGRQAPTNREFHTHSEGDGCAGGQREQVASLHEEEILTATLEAVDKVRAYCDHESRLVRAEVDQAWNSCNKAERRLRRVAFLAAAVFVAAILGVGWLDKLQARKLATFQTQIKDAQAALESEMARRNGEAESIQIVFDTYRAEAESAREAIQEQLTNARAALAASKVEIDHVCWERDEAMRDRERLSNEIASQRAHIEKMRGLQANAAAKSLRNLLDETWDASHQGPFAPTNNAPDAAAGTTTVMTEVP